MDRKAEYSINRGFSLVEVMVALVIGLLAMIVILQVFSLSEGSKRTSTSGSDAQQNGSMALFTIERDLRQAGYGMISLPALGCTINGFDQGPPARSITGLGLQLAPVVITQGGAGAPDGIAITYSGSEDVGRIATLKSVNNGNNSNYQVWDNSGFNDASNIGNLILVVESGNPRCTLAEINSNVGSGSDNIIHNPGANNPRFNVASGVGVTHQPGSLIINLGSLPGANNYTVTVPSAAVPSGQLNRQNSIMEAVPTPIVDGVVNLQAEYGMDDGVNDGSIAHTTYVAGDKIVDHWTTLNPTTPTAWSQVVAIRLAVLARSGLREKPNRSTGQCTTTTTVPTWASTNANSVFSNSGALSSDADGTSWKCYRYRVYETTVPLRNMIWQ